MAKPVLHKQIYKHFIGGATVNTTLCGRLHRGNEMNVADSDDQVTCKFCLRLLEREAIKRLSVAVADVERDYPLPRCSHGNALQDHAGEILEPSCGCRKETDVA